MLGQNLKLFIWLSSAFPIGAFAYSHGLESAVETGDVTNADDLADWLRDLLWHGSIQSDCILLAAAWRAAQDGSSTGLENVNNLALALAPSRERHLETSAQGAAFLAAACASWPCTALGLFGGSREVAYPVALGALAAGHGVALRSCAEAFALAFVAALVSAAVRLGPIGQTAGQMTLAALLPEIERLTAEIEQVGLDDLGACALRSDIAAMRHETQYSRLFRS